MSDRCARTRGRRANVPRCALRSHCSTLQMVQMSKGPPTIRIVCSQQSIVRSSQSTTSYAPEEQSPKRSRVALRLVKPNGMITEAVVSESCETAARRLGQNNFTLEKQEGVAMYHSRGGRARSQLCDGAGNDLGAVEVGLLRAGLG